MSKHALQTESDRTAAFVTGTAARITAMGVAAVGILAAGARAEEAPSGAAPAGGSPAIPPQTGAVSTLPAIEVTGTATVLPHDVPQSLQTVTQQEISEQGISSMQDVLRNVPGITINAGEGGAHGDSVNLRGLSVPDSFFLDGLRDIGLYQRDTFDDEAVEPLAVITEAPYRATFLGRARAIMSTSGCAIATNKRTCRRSSCTAPSTTSGRMADSARSVIQRISDRRGCRRLSVAVARR